jgi:hypothetical protein
MKTEIFLELKKNLKFGLMNQTSLQVTFNWWLLAHSLNDVNFFTVQSDTKNFLTKYKYDVKYKI